MKKTTFIIAFFCFLFSNATEIINPPITTLIVEDAVWSYYDLENEPSNDGNGNAWNVLAFNDASWATGNAELGYGDTQATLINTNTLTAYFRKSFTVTDPSQFGDLNLEAIRDDGMIVYLNGTEVWRDGMPSGAADYNTFATTTIGGADETTWIQQAVFENLLAGTNVIAVEIHQRSAGSSDLSFNFRMSAEEATGFEYISLDSEWAFYDLENEPANDGSGNTWKTSNFNDANWATGNAELGYGDTQTTLINDAALTAYFRKSFNVVNPSAWDNLRLEAIRDDGMVVYLNGAEVWRDGMPEGAIDYNTFSTQVIGGADETTLIEQILINNLSAGTNVIAVEIHQTSATSSDISFNFRLKGENDIPAEVTRGPYLQSGTENSAIIRWRTNTPSETKVNYGSDFNNLSLSSSDANKKTEHEVLLTNLDPDTKYYYNLENSLGVYLDKEAEMFVKTSPAVGSDTFVRAWVLGDPGTANQNQKNVRDQYYNYVSNATQNPGQSDLMLFLGDNAYNSGTDTEYQNAFYDIYGAMLKKSVAWSCLGNHDGYSANSNSQSGPYYDMFTFPKAGEAGGVSSGTEAYYSFDYANIHFIVLESYTLYNDTTQMDWCLNDIQSTTQDWIVTLFHHPPYTKGSHNSDTEINSIQMRTNFLSILEDNGVDLVLNGHSHSYERSFFLNGHYGDSDTFNAASHTVGANGNLSGKQDTTDGAYQKSATDSAGAVYITTGSAGKISGGSLDHEAMYYSVSQLGSCVLEVSNNPTQGQDLTIKFITDTGAITDYFTINKTFSTLSVNEDFNADNEIKVYPVPANQLLNIKTDKTESLKFVTFYNALGQEVKKTSQAIINVSTLAKGAYVIKVETNNQTYFKSIVLE